MPSEPGTNAILTVWNLKTLQPDVELVGDDCTVKFWASFNSEGTVLVASTSKSYTNACDISEFFNVAPIRTIHIWDVSLRRDVASLDVRRDADERYQPLGFSSDGKFLAVGEQTNDFELYRLTAGSAPEQIAYIKDFLNFRSVFNVDGSLILTMDNLWETETGKNVSPWPKPQDPPFILDTAFSPDGTTIGILMPDSTIQLWRVQ